MRAIIKKTSKGERVRFVRDGVPDDATDYIEVFANPDGPGIVVRSAWTGLVVHPRVTNEVWITKDDES